MRLVYTITLIIFLMASTGFSEVRSSLRLRVTGSITAPTPCHILNQCPAQGSETFMCTQVVAPLVGRLRFTKRSNSKRSFFTDASGIFSLRIPKGRYSVSFDSFDGVAVGCLSTGRACSKVMNSSGFASPQMIEISDALVTQQNRRLSLVAKAKACN